MSAEIRKQNITTNEPRLQLGNKPRELIEYRNLLKNLVVRDLKVKYKNSALGVIWSLLNPLLMMTVFGLVFTFAFGQDIRQYPVFFLAGLLPWRFFTGALITGTVSITSNSALIKKVFFPRELLPVSALISSLVDFGFALIILVVFLYASGLGLTIQALWIIPLLFAQILFVLGLSLLLGAINVFYRDVLMILDSVLLAWFFLTPIMYSLNSFGDSVTVMGIELDPAQVIRWLNPMASTPLTIILSVLETVLTQRTPNCTKLKDKMTDKVLSLSLYHHWLLANEKNCVC